MYYSTCTYATDLKTGGVITENSLEDDVLEKMLRMADEQGRLEGWESQVSPDGRRCIGRKPLSDMSSKRRGPTHVRDHAGRA